MADRLIGGLVGGQYRIQSHLGAGGFGDVFRAVQEKTGQTVAVKVLRPRYGKNAPGIDRQIARFRREMRVCAELHHPHIVRLIDSGETEASFLFSVFEYVPGTTLAELLHDKGALPVRTAIDLMLQVLDALVCAHARGVIHRDLKPNNIMVSTTGSRPQITVLDFGISAFLEGMLLDEFESLTITREILGTPSYAAPEQLRGEAPSVKSDLYAWALVFTECILGRRVFDGPSAVEVAYRQLSADPVRLPDKLQKHWLGVLLRWALEKDVSRRAGAANEILERLLEKRPLGDLVDANGFFVGGEQDGPAGAGRIATGERDPAEITGRSAGSLPAGERRQITALCCAISIGEAAADRSPELLDQALRDAQALCIGVAARFGGTPAGTLGGQVLLYFGFPRANDTDARRSGIVALEIAQELRRRNADSGEIPIEIRIGIHTGIVTVLGSEGRPASPVFGITPNVAIQLALRAPANAILASADSHRYLAASFELHAETPASGGAAAYRLVAESRAESAAVSSGASSRVPLVGREHELMALEAAWRRAREQAGTCVVLMGEPGIGKSRLARELRRSIEGAGSRWLETRCLPEMSQSALRPIVDLLAQHLDLSAASGEEGARRLEAALRDLGLDPAEPMPLLCPWLGLPLVDPYRPLPYSPQKQKALSLELLATIVLTVADRQSAPILIEDLHWADPTTLEFLDLLIRRLPSSHGLLLLTTRPDVGSASWPRESVETIELKSLDTENVATIVKALMGVDSLAPKLLEDVARRADGIPLFIEEIVRFVQESITHNGGATPIAAASEQPVPARLRDLLTSRLDRLGRAKETAQIAAAIGREFDYRLLAQVVSGDEALLLADLDQMVSADLLIRRRRVDNPLYMFRHALMRDAAYESLLSGSRQRIHGRIAGALETTFVDVVDRRPELLAHHLAEGGDKERAIEYAKRATGAALAGSLYHEAAAHATRALGWVDTVQDRQRRPEVELELISLLAPALMSISGWGSENVRKSIDRAEELSQQVSPHASTQYAVLWLLLMYHNIRANWARFDEVQARALSICQQTGNRVLECVVRAIVGQALFTRGRLPESRMQLDRALDLYNSDAHAAHRKHFGQDVEVFILASQGLLLSLMGYCEQARAAAHRALERAQELESPYNICMAKAFLAGTWHYQGERAKTSELCASLLEDSDAFGFADWPPIARILGGWAGGVIDGPAAEIDRILALGNRYGGPYWSFTVAQSELAAGRFDDALVRIERALNQSEEIGVYFYAPELLRLKGECLAAKAIKDLNHQERLQEAHVFLEMAVQLARRQEAKLPELRALTVAAKLSRGGRDRDMRRDEMAELVSWFTKVGNPASATELQNMLVENS